METETVDQIQHLIINDGINALARMIRIIEHLWRFDPKVPHGTPGGVLATHNEIPICLTDLCHAFALASTSIFDASEKRSKEAPAIRELRQARAQYIAEVCDGIDISILTDRTVRNRIAHTDEYIAEICAKNEGIATIGQMAFSTRSMIAIPEWGVAFIRCYIFDEKKMLHLGSEFDVGTLHDAASQALERLVPDWRGVNRTREHHPPSNLRKPK